MSITTNLKEIAQLYYIKKDGRYGNNYIDSMLHYNKWPHPADIVTLKPANKEGNHTLTIYTDGSKSEHGTGSGIIIFKLTITIPTEIPIKLQIH
jgi:hypothetical protein